VLARREILAVTRYALVGFVVLLALVHAICGWWTPVQGDAWLAWIWHARHIGDGPATWLATHFELASAIGYASARSDVANAIITSLAAIALVLGVFTVAMRRVPRATWSDVLAVAMVSALIWIAQPHAAVAWFHRSSVATYVVGSAVAAWFAAPYVCSWRVPSRLAPLVALGGYAAGTSSRAIAAVTLVGIALIVRRSARRERWMIAGLVGLVVGTAVGYARAPYFEVGRVLKRGLEPNLFILRLPAEGSTRIISVVALLAVVAALLRVSPPADERPDATVALRWFGAFAATAVWCLFGPHYFEATLLPATCLLVAGALPFVTWYARVPALRRAIAVFAIAVHAIVWPLAIASSHHFGVEGEARMAVLEHTPPGELAVVKPYSQILGTPWFFGEDLATAHQRSLVASEVFGLRDIAFEPEFRRLEPSPEIRVVLVVDGISNDDVRAAHPPAAWASEVAAAREQFAAFMKRLEAITGSYASARLAVTNLALPAAGTRPLVVAWSDEHGVFSPRIARSTLDEENQISTKIYGDAIREFDEAWVLHDGTATKTPYRNGVPKMRPAADDLYAMVICNARLCLVADALVGRF
jgi:hypothetical protein